jgi:transcriptional regulator with XRE-family HTH domain
MAAHRRMTLRAQWLGRQFREMREAAGLTMPEAAGHLDRDGSGVSRFENGILPLPQGDVATLLDLYGVRDRRRRDVLTDLADQAWRTDWWDGYADEVDPEVVDYVWLESRSIELRSYNVTTVDGLLQTAAYARAVLRSAEPQESDRQVDRWVEMRVMRQAILERSEPPHLGVVLDEGALRRVVGGPSVHALQLRQVAERAARPDVEVQVLPFVADPQPWVTGSFRLFVLPEPVEEVACVESPGGLVFLEPPQSARFLDAHERLRETALAPDESVKLILAAADELEHASPHVAARR